MSIMRICFFCDAHGNNDSFQTFVEKAGKQNIDLFVFGGDAVGYYYGYNDILNTLRFMKNTVCLLGNHDQMLLDALDRKLPFSQLIEKYGNGYSDIEKRITQENIAFLRSLPSAYRLHIDGLQLGFFHGGPGDPLNMRIYPDTDAVDIDLFTDYDYVFCGHTHHKTVKQFGSCILLNPGSIGQQRDGKGCSYIIFDSKMRTYQFYCVDYDRKNLVNAIRKRENNSFMRDRLIEVLYRERK